MMNVRALCVLLSSLGTVMFLSPEPTVRKMSNDVVLVEAAGSSILGRSSDAPKKSARDVLRDAVNAASDAASKTKDEVSAGVHQASEAKAEYARESLGDSLHRVGDAAHNAGDSMSHAGEQQETLGSKLARAVQEAAQYQPNLGQGLGYYAQDQDRKRMEEYLEGARSSARDAMDKATEGLDLLRNKIQELQPHEEHPSLDTARRKIQEYYDVTKNAVVSALSKKEQQLGSSLESSKKRVEAYYDKAKGASLESLESQKEKLGQFLDVVRLKLNAGREAVFNYGMSAIQSSKEAVIDEKNKWYLRVLEVEEEAARWGKKINRTWNMAGAWAHHKLVNLNQTEEISLRVCRQWMITVTRLLHLFLFSSTFGSALWVTFISGFVLSTNIPRHQFAMVQSKIFPVYFRIVGSGIALLLATHIVLHPLQGAALSEILQCYNLAACLAVTLLNAFALEPRLTKCVFDRVRLEKEEGRGAAASGIGDAMVDTTARLQALHLLSSAANLTMLAGLAWHLWHLNCRLAI